MSDDVHRTCRPNRNESRGGAALNILVLVVGAALIAGLVIYSEKCGLFDSGGGSEDVQSPRAPATRKADAGNPPTPGPVEIADVPPKPPRADNETAVKVSKPVEPKFIGDAEWKRYHRIDCKYVKSIREDKKVPLYSASEAFEKGYIPCKVCSPEVPGQGEEASSPERPVQPVGPAQGTMDAPRPVSTRLIGDAGRRRYHRADCKLATSVAEGRKVPFKSPADAFAGGYFPCRTCNPDLPALLAELPPLPVAPVKDGRLTEAQKRAMYVSLFALKGMLKGIGTRERPYEVLSDRYRVPTTTVEAVEAEGDARNWPVH